MRGIFDFSTIEAIAVPKSFLTTYARLPQTNLMAQERKIVAPQPEVYELATLMRFNNAIPATWSLRLC